METGIPVVDGVLRDEDLFGADEAFLTSTSKEVVPIVRVDDRVIGAGTPGPITLRLLDVYRRKARAVAGRALGGLVARRFRTRPSAGTRT